MSNDENIFIEVFQDLILTSCDARHAVLREALYRNATSPWRHAEESELALHKSTREYLAFQRSPSDNIAASSLTLRERTDGYEVMNIVPLEEQDLGISGYNDVLNDFIERIVNPAAQELKLGIALTLRKQSITDWVSSEAASALHTFSACANKSTGADHPMDRERWFKFISAAYDTNSRFSTYLLGRWLVEAEKWPPETAADLVDSYQYSMDLLESRAVA